MFRKIFTILGVLIVLASFFIVGKPVLAASTNLSFHQVPISSAPSLPSSMKAMPIACYIEVWTPPGNSNHCYGTGYSGFQLYNVNEVDNLGTEIGWIRYYHGGPGIFCWIYPGGAAWFGPGGVKTGVEVTQAYYPGVQGNECPKYI